MVGTGAVDLPLELASSQTVSVARADERILSLVYSYYEFTGGVHGNYVDRAYVFDSETGEELTLDKLTTDFDAFTALWCSIWWKRLRTRHIILSASTPIPWPGSSTAPPSARFSERVPGISAARD